MAVITMKQLLEAGVHFGHQTRRWNPKMKKYIFTERNGIYIIDLQKTVKLIDDAYDFIKDAASDDGVVLFVGTKKQAQEAIEEEAKRAGQYYVNHRWLGGMLTNWKTVNNSIKRMKELCDTIEHPEGLTKKEILGLKRKYEKLEKVVGGVKDMGGVPNLLVIIDTIREAVAVKEARKLGIPIVAIVDSNSDPDDVTYKIPGNDDAKAIIPSSIAV